MSEIIGGFAGRLRANEPIRRRKRGTVRSPALRRWAFNLLKDISIGSGASRRRLRPASGQAPPRSAPAKRPRASPAAMCFHRAVWPHSGRFHESTSPSSPPYWRSLRSARLPPVSKHHFRPNGRRMALLIRWMACRQFRWLAPGRAGFAAAHPELGSPRTCQHWSDAQNGEK
jgi:hypothetical protein